MVEIFTILSEQPEKIKKVIINILKVLITILFAQYLYRAILGSFVVLKYSDIDGVLNFFLSGKILICVLFYLIAEFILFAVLAAIYELFHIIITTIQNKMKAQDHLIEAILSTFNVISIEKSKNRIVPGQNFKDAYQFLFLFADAKSKEELNESFISQSRQLYLPFVVVYFIMLEPLLHNMVLNISILLGMLVVIILEIIVENLFIYIEKNHKYFIQTFNIIAIDKIVTELLIGNNVEILNKLPINKGLKFKLNDRKYRMVYVPDQDDIDAEYITNRILTNRDIAIKNIYIFEKTFFEHLGLFEIENERRTFLVYENDIELKNKIRNLVFSL